MEKEYPRVGAEFAKYDDCKDRVFFRGNRSTEDVLQEAEDFFGTVKDDSEVYDNQLDMFGDESCEVWSGCGDD